MADIIIDKKKALLSKIILNHFADEDDKETAKLILEDLEKFEVYKNTDLVERNAIIDYKIDCKNCTKDYKAWDCTYCPNIVIDKLLEKVPRFNPKGDSE